MPLNLAWTICMRVALGNGGQNGLCDFPWTFRDAESFFRATPRVDFDHFGSGNNLNASPRDASQAAVQRRSDDLGADGGDRLAMYDPRSNFVARFEASVSRCIDVTFAPVAIDLSRLSRERQ